jgi:methylated-DNA--[protein]-cysteine S-methyltransferase
LGWEVEIPKDRLIKKETINTQVWEEVRDAPFVIRTLQWLDQYMDRGSADLPPLHIYGSPFRFTVWTSLLDIPWGETWTYTELAKIVHTKFSLQPALTSLQPSMPNHKSDFPQLFIRSVATAVAHNPLSVLLPCHRVLGSSGNLCGYAGGIERKIALLAHEGAVLLKLSPNKNRAFHQGQTAALFSVFCSGHVLQYVPFNPNALTFYLFIKH